MNRLRTITLSVSGLVIVAGLAGLMSGLTSLAEFEPTVQAAGQHDITFDVACDCRMGSPAFFKGNRGDAWIISGKIFPAGTLPTGTATNDPTQPVGRIAPIGEWTCRGQSGLPFPSAVASAYSASPPAFNTQYFTFNNNRRALTVEGYALPGFTGERLSVTGGIGGFSGAAGDVEEAPFGTNATGCPNFRVKFRIQPGSVRGDWDD
jgi:hypothetical protein